jgi:hypothetical protein
MEEQEVKGGKVAIDTVKLNTTNMCSHLQKTLLDHARDS